MLSRLSISNYALIRNLDISFREPFSVITGETGAGKSIILGALSLILGQRADNLSLPDKSRKCVIEGVFDISKCALKDFFAENDLDYDQQCIIRREITQQGKSRAFINDTPVNLNQLKDLTSRLVDVHSQHQTLLLQETSFQLSVIDSVAGNKMMLDHYRKEYNSLKGLEKQENELITWNTAARAELDYLNFLFDELDKAALLPGEQDLLENETEVLTHAEEIKSKLFNAAELLQNQDDNILRRMNEVGVMLQAAAKYHADIEEFVQRIAACNIEIQDIGHAIDRMAEDTKHDPARLSLVNERLALLYQLQQKHQVKTLDELIEKKNSIEERIQAIESSDEALSKIKLEIAAKRQELGIASAELTRSREAVVSSVEKMVLDSITQLGMKDARFTVSVTPLPESGRNGSDQIRFLFSANKGSDLNELAKIASGGELSRLMLAVKSMISASNLLPTIIFDEIDIGISGDVAARVGNILQQISQNMQVIAITHLPQIAGKSREHFKVYKFTENEKTFSSIEKLSPEERIGELALMISGNASLEAARETARELLRNN